MNSTKAMPLLLVFAQVARLESFTAAADSLGMSKSAVSQQLKRLEEQLGQQLLIRNTRGMALTSVGEKLFSRCELLQDQVDLALQELESNKASPSGVFSITLPHSCERDVVIPALRQLCIEYPGIEPNVVVSDQVIDLVQNKLDVALTFGDLQDSQYRALPIGATGEIFCASAAYVIQHNPVECIDDLQTLGWIRAPWQQQKLFAYENAAPVTKIEIMLSACATTNALSSAVEMVLNHMGAALLPSFIVAPLIASGQLVQILPAHQGRQWPFYMVHRFQTEKPVHVTRFYQLVKHYFIKVNC